MRSTTAPGCGMTPGASARARTDFPVPDSPPTATSVGAGGWISLLRKLEIGPCRSHDIGLVASGPVEAGQQHIGADRRAQRHEQRQRCERVEIFAGCDRKISVEQGVRRGLPAVAEEIHHRKRKIVEHIDRGDVGIELDRIEQDGLALDQHDVRQMQVAVASPHISLLCRAAPAAREVRKTRTATLPRDRRCRPRESRPRLGRPRCCLR